MDILSVRNNCNKENSTILFYDYILGNSYFLHLGFDLSLVLQQGHEVSSVRKKNAHKEHHF